MPMRVVNRPAVSVQCSATYKSRLDGDLPHGFARDSRPLRLVPDLSEYDPAEDRIRKQLVEMGVHPLGGSACGLPRVRGPVQL